MQEISSQLQQVLCRIAQACDQCGRKQDEVMLLAVSKKQGIAAVQTAYQAGQRDFGENYVQEALEKIQALSHLPIT